MKHLLVSLVIPLFLFLAIPLHAQSPTERDLRGAVKERVQTRVQEGKENLRATISDSMENRCSRISTAIDARIATYTNNQKVPHEWGSKVAAVLDTILAKAKVEGINTTELEQTRTEFQSKVETVKTSHAAFITSLQDTKESACGQSNGSFVTALGHAGEELKTLRASVVDLRHYYQSEVRPVLINLRNSQEQ